MTRRKPQSATDAPYELTSVSVRLLRTDGAQPPAGLDDETFFRYAEAMSEGLWDWERSSTPIVAFHDGADWWVADGHHRVEAAKEARLEEVQVEIRHGTLRDARWFSFSVNAEHGYARDRYDVARILQAIFADDEWRAMPLREISRHTRVPFETVRRHHEKAAVSNPVGQIAKPATRTVTRAGTTYTMDTGAIGKAQPPPAAHKPPPITTPQPVPPINLAQEPRDVGVTTDPIGELHVETAATPAPASETPRQRAKRHADALGKVRALLGEARGLVADIESELREAFDERSERWQESEKGQEAEAEIERIDEVCSAIESALTGLPAE